jgi:hypothetical protein
MRIKRRPLLLIGLSALGVCVCLGAVAWLLPSEKVTKANFDRIKYGMTKAMLTEILGKPSMLVGHSFGGSVSDYTLCWESSNGSRAMVSCSLFDDIVYSKEWRPSNETPWDMFCRWLRLK